MTAIAPHVLAAADAAALERPESVSLADQGAFDALPEATRLLARKVLLGGARDHESAFLAGYRAGFEDAADAVEVPMASQSDEQRALEAFRRGR